MATLCRPPLPLSFTAITNYPGEEEVPLSCGPQLSAVPVRIPISFWTWAAQSAVGGGPFSQASSLALSNWTAGTALFWENSRNHSTLLHTAQIKGEGEFRPG
jgi:hypothetical protein